MEYNFRQLYSKLYVKQFAIVREIIIPLTPSLLSQKQKRIQLRIIKSSKSLNHIPFENVYCLVV